MRGKKVVTYTTNYTNCDFSYNNQYIVGGGGISATMKNIINYEA